ncbi:alpha-hydroxy acid oxidase [Streptomyces sp. enrichment culture]|uniref:alpha-hydroxy acid oxidase n=1 Tax=Streptomyces sp. enrichment culture TaxID=1795815 RepID=UPI003F54E200
MAEAPSVSTDLEALYDLHDVARAAEQRVPRPVWDFIEGGSGQEGSLRANHSVLDSVFLVPRVLQASAQPNMGTRLLGAPVALPLVVAPMAYQRLVHPEGEVAVGRAARAAGVPFVVPMLSSVPVERIAEGAGTLWLQLYWLRDRGLLTELVDRAKAAGCAALMVTVDVPRMGRRLRDVRNAFALPEDVGAVHLSDADMLAAQHQVPGRSAVASHTRQSFDPAFDWSCLEWLRSHTDLPIVVKGVLDPRDAVLAESLGAHAVVVSNHGGRQLDGAVPGFSVLPAVREAVSEACEVWVDGGFRSGVDVLKALASGATAALIGRPVLWGLALGGEDGVGKVLDLLRDELEDALALSGCADLEAAAGLGLVGELPRRLERHQ